MGRMHAQAWRTAHRFFDLPLEPELTVVVGRDADRTARAARTLGAAEQSTDWSEVIGRADVDLVDICTPGDTHAAIAVAALEADTHVLCEKPLANDVAEAERMAQAAGRALDRGVVSMCGFSYRRTPALALARRLVAEGRIGRVRHVRAQYLQDWLSDPDAPFTWRLDSDRAGPGALGDIGAHSTEHRAVADRRPHRGRVGHDAHVRRHPAPAGRAGRPRPPQREPHRAQRGPRVPGLRLRAHERARALRRGRSRRRAGLPPHPGHRADPSLRGGVVAARARSGLRAPVHASGRRPRARHRGRRRRSTELRRGRPGPACARSRRGEHPRGQHLPRSGRNPLMTRTALVVRGGWDGHRPVDVTNFFVPFLEEHGFEVRIEESSEAYADEPLMLRTDLVVQSVTMSEISREAFRGLAAAARTRSRLASRTSPSLQSSTGCCTTTSSTCWRPRRTRCSRTTRGTARSPPRSCGPGPGVTAASSSPRRGTGSTCSATRTSGRLSTGGSCGRAARHRSSPVSYTHLRAH